MINPDSHIRSYFFNTLNGQVVDNKTITIHDFRVPFNGTHYIIMNAQSSEPNRDNKCDIISYNARINLDIVTIFDGVSGSRLFADNIKEMVMNATQNITIAGFNVDEVNVTYPDDLDLLTNTQSIFRKLITYEFKITQL